MNVPRVDWVRILVAVALAIGLWGWVHAYGKVAEANAYRAERERAEAQRDSANAALEAAQREQLRIDSIAADSIARLEAENRRIRAEREAERREAEERAREARQASDSLSTAIVEAVSGPEKPVVRELVRQKDAEAETERRAHAAQLLSLEAQLDEERSLWAAERNVLRDQLSATNARADAAEEVIRGVREQVRLLNQENDALRDARGVGIMTRLKWAGVGMLVGAAGWEAVR